MHLSYPEPSWPLCLRHMASFKSRLAVFFALSTSLGCIGRTPAPVNDLPDPSPTRPLSGSTVTSYDIDQNPPQPIKKILQSQVRGVTIAGTSEGCLSNRIRGASNINGSNEPLYVIDGLPIQPGP